MLWIRQTALALGLQLGSTAPYWQFGRSHQNVRNMLRSHRVANDPKHPRVCQYGTFDYGHKSKECCVEWAWDGTTCQSEGVFPNDGKLCNGMGKSMEVQKKKKNNAVHTWQVTPDGLQPSSAPYLSPFPWLVLQPDDLPLTNRPQ